MISNDNKLFTEIIKRIMGNLGIVPFPNFGKVGITTNEFKNSAAVILQDEKGIQESINIYAGEININASEKIRAAFVNLSDANTAEFILTFRFNNLAIYALRLTFDDIDSGTFIVNDDLKWYNVNSITQIQCLLGIEILTQEGTFWHPTDDCQDLLNAIIHMLE